MEKKMTFNYFYGTEADQFSFYRIPKALFTDSYFKDLSSDDKILYGLPKRAMAPFFLACSMGSSSVTTS